MKIIRHGIPQAKFYEGRCEECGCEFECQRDETFVGHWRYALCPCCKHLVHVRRTEASNG